MNYPKSKKVPGTHYIGTWSDKNVPVYDLLNSDGLNQLVGYVKHLNADNGTVLYRGQCDLYEHIIPSIKHNESAFSKNEKILKDSLANMLSDKEFNKFVNWDCLVSDWKTYTEVAYEALLQHYGVPTKSVDFVDNHWAALWFSLFRYDSKNHKYIRRDEMNIVPDKKHIKFTPYFDKLPKKPVLRTAKLSPSEIAKIKKTSNKPGVSYRQLKDAALLKRQRLAQTKFDAEMEEYNEAKRIQRQEREYFEKRNKEAHAYLFLYLSDTTRADIHGMYIGKNTYTIDLRKVLPSTFLRPIAQHGWIVRGRDDSYSFDNHVLCVIRMPVKLVDDMLGNGTLLSQQNFFPSSTIDQGYNILLQRQIDAKESSSKVRKYFPKNMISYI